TTGKAALYQLGLTGIPITNVNNNCATGSAALVRACDACFALAFGFKHMGPGALDTKTAFSECFHPMHQLLAAAERASPDSMHGPPMLETRGSIISGTMETGWSIWRRLASSVFRLCACDARGVLDGEGP
ncbi:hypothetical protein EDB83DRAFT_2350715, partial [Lactarius deliciosus]